MTPPTSPSSASLSVTSSTSSYAKAARLAFDAHLQMPITLRAALLRGLAQALASESESLAALADMETHLGLPRLKGEIQRTCYQLTEFAAYIEQGKHLRQLSQTSVQGAPPEGRPALEITAVPLGPVVVFAASNFPFAFSVLGGDTASALAAGCPVIVKAHPAHLRLSEKVFDLAQKVLRDLQMPASWIAMLAELGYEAGLELVMQPEIAAVSFTGSVHAGKALAKHIAQRERPIPFFGELGSINPVLVLPGFLAHQPAESAHVLADSIVQGAGQFCTSPGVIVVDESPQADAFIAALAKRLESSQPHQMLTPSMQNHFDRLRNQAKQIEGVRLSTSSSAPATPSTTPEPTLLTVSLATWLAQTALHEEVFGPFAVVVQVSGDTSSYAQALSAIEGSLTVTFWAHDADKNALQHLTPLAMQRAGRVLFGGVPTGVAIAEAQHHGGPWPASTQPSSTSVGMRSIERFLRPVVLQSKPDWMSF